MEKARSLLETKTFWGALAGLLVAVGPVAMTCTNAHRWPTSKEAGGMMSAAYVFGWAMVGRVATSPVYTPNGLPGPDKSDLETGP